MESFRDSSAPKMQALMFTLIDKERRVWVSTGRWCPWGDLGRGGLETFVCAGDSGRLVQHDFHTTKKAFHAHLAIVEEVKAGRFKVRN